MKKYGLLWIATAASLLLPLSAAEKNADIRTSMTSIIIVCICSPILLPFGTRLYCYIISHNVLQVNIFEALPLV